MGVVKNLMIRIGADVRGVVGGMKTAYSATRQATSQIKNATSGMKHSVKDSFSGSRISIREYKETVASLKTAHNTAAQNTERLQEKLEQMQATYDSIKSATAGINLSTPLTEQIKESEDSWHGFLNEAQKVKETLKKELSLDNTKSDPEKIESLRHDLQILRTAVSEAELELRRLQSVAAAIGADNISFASVSGLDTLRAEINRIQQELDISKIKTGDLGQKLKSLSIPNLIKAELKSIGAAASAAARAGVKQLGSNLKNVAVSGAKSLATLPFRLLSIGKSASSSNRNLEKMLRSIRNIGIVSLGIRAVGGIYRGLFGEMQSIISNFIAQNEELNATISNMKMQLGQALAPAIYIVVAAMQRLLPLIQTVANVISAIFTRLFGAVKTITAGVKSSAEAAKSAAEKLQLYSFDQINKVSDNSETSGGTGSGAMSDFGTTPAWLDSLLKWIDKLKAAFKAGDWEGLGRIIGDGINAVVNAINAVGIGTKVGTFVNNLFTTLNSALATIDFFNIGKKLGELVTAGFQAVNWSTVGETIGRAITAIPSIVVGFIQNTDWALVAKSLSNALTSMLRTVIEWFRTVEWSELGEAIGTFLRNIDWIGVFKSLGTLMWEGFKAALELLGGFIKGLGPGMIISAIAAVISAVSLKIAGTTLFSSLWGVLKHAMVRGGAIIVSAIGGWPTLIIAAAAAAIAAIALWMHSGGGDIVAGFLQGIKEGFANVGAWLSTTWESIAASLDTKLSNMRAKLEQGWAKIKASTASGWKEIGNAVNEQLKVMQSTSMQQVEILRQQLVQGWSSMYADSSNYLSQLVQNVRVLFGDMRSESSKIFSDLRSDLQRTWTSINSQLSNCLNTMYVQFQKTHAQLQNNAESAWQSIQRSIKTRTDSIASALDNFRTKLSNSFTGMNTTISNAMTSMVANISNGFANMLSWVQNTINSIISSISNMVSSAVNGAKQVANALAGATTSKTGSSSKTTTSSASTSKTSSSSKTTTSSASTSKTSSGSQTTASSGSGWLSSIKALFGLGGSSPRLATGGITTGPTYALIGESGKEAVMPLEHNTGWMEMLAAKLVSAGSNGSGTSITIPIYFGKRKVSEYVIQEINQITKTTGVCPIHV